MDKILSGKPGEKTILLGNEAIIRGALEAGVQFVATYPGTPASEIGNNFFRIQNSESKVNNLYFEFSTNEKVALEAGIGASFSGLKTLVAMKNFGVNVCSDPLLPFCYSGSLGPTVIVVADDPSCHSSAQTEENSRPFAYLAHIPVIEPSDPQECKDFVKYAYQISEDFESPVIVRTTTRVAHQKSIVSLSRLSLPKTSKGEFVKNPRKFVTMPPRVLEMHKELIEKIGKIREIAEKSKINLIDGKIQGEIGIITSGVSYLHIKEALKELKIELPILKLGFFYPLPEEKIKKFIGNFKKVLIVEELDPFLEKEVARLAKDANCQLQIFGKNVLPEVGEIKPEFVVEAISKLTGRKIEVLKQNVSVPKLKRFPQLCPGCPYWLAFGAIKQAAPKDTIFGGDIGCYMLAGLPPHQIQDYLSCMGSSIGIAHGVKKATNQKVISLIGDSTFFHAGIPPLVNAVFNRSNPLIIILNNQTTAMTGHQPHPAAPGSQNVNVKIEDVVRACGVKNLKIIDQGNQQEFIGAIKEFLEKAEVSVIIARRPCKFVAPQK